MRYSRTVLQSWCTAGVLLVYCTVLLRLYVTASFVSGGCIGMALLHCMVLLRCVGEALGCGCTRSRPAALTLLCALLWAQPPALHPTLCPSYFRI